MGEINVDQFGFGVRNINSAHNPFPAITQTERMVDRTEKLVEEITEKAEGSALNVRVI